MDNETDVVTREDLDDPNTEGTAPGVHEHAPTANRSGMRGGESVIRAHVGTVEAEELQERILAEAPGRIVGYEPEPKPEPGSTPWTSGEYVNERHSADGNPYRLGETIPEPEARRQGLFDQPAPPPISGGSGLHACSRCHGQGTFSKVKPPGHAMDCGCQFCGVCPRCNGTRFEKEVV